VRHYPVPRRRLEDQIQELCQKVVSNDDPQQTPHLFAELRSALHEHVRRIRQKAAAHYVSTGKRRETPIQNE
jgi:hypothetical protein